MTFCDVPLAFVLHSVYEKTALNQLYVSYYKRVIFEACAKYWLSIKIGPTCQTLHSVAN